MIFKFSAFRNKREVVSLQICVSVTERECVCVFIRIPSFCQEREGRERREGIKKKDL